MNIGSIFGLIISAVVFVVGLRLATDDLMMFWDAPSVFIVIGGTFAATAITYRIDKIFMLFRIFLRHIFTGKTPDYASLIAEIMKIGDAYRRGESLEAHINKTSDNFLKEALTLINDGVLEQEHLLRILDDRAANLNYMYTEDANKIKNLSQYPPAFGMLGTTIGMVVLLGSLGGEDAMKKIGPAMSVCLITTVYGCALANMVVIPIAENLATANKIAHLKNLIIIEGVKNLLNKQNPVIVAEELNSYLPPSQRLDWKEVIGK
jgi:chemotaxis protein MotA